jgi:pterin-4a-carbinolamine dehydratase
MDIIVTEFADRFGFCRIDAELDFPTPVDQAPQLSDSEIAEALKRLPGWEIETRESQRGKDGIAIELVTTLKFRNFEDVIHYMATAARYISRTEHHPFWENQYKDLRIRICTWDIGLRIAAKDIKLADYLLWLYRDYMPGEQPARPASPVT